MDRNDSTYYRIGDMVFQVTAGLSFPLEYGPSCDFRVSPTAPDRRYVFEKVQSIDDFTGKLTLKNSEKNYLEFVDGRGGYVRGFEMNTQLYDIALRLEPGGGRIAYLSETLIAQRLENRFDPINFLALEYVFLENGGFFLHSSHINVGGKALLFSAPSGTGKSTQAALWAQHAGAEIINGDRTLLRERDGVWRAYGCPMCGTSGIHRQGVEPIHAIVMLSQSAENAVTRLTAGEAFQRLYPEITVPRWDRALVLRAMELLDALMARVPIYALACTPDERAVTALREAIGL